MIDATLEQIIPQLSAGGKDGASGCLEYVVA